MHYCVANIPGAVARTSTIALTVGHPAVSGAGLPHTGCAGAAAADPALAKGLSTLGGELTNQPVAEAHGLAYRDPSDVLAGS